MPALETPSSNITPVVLKPETYQRAKEEAPGWDIYHIEREWYDWMVEKPKNPDAAFIGFAKKWFEKRGRP